ncbi:hypothetical protein [Taklimakanibacter lacteus]|uniref:hypothetical protein n=1 Tax=Taklimakanibacter lacteus TaxID=2268456 RepID=UPI0013C538D8
MLNSRMMRVALLAACTIAFTADLALAAKKLKLASLPPNNDYSRSVSVGSDRGGVVLNYGLRMLRWRQNGTKVRFSGSCQSACTLYLGLAPSQVCVSPGASFSFHSPFGASAHGNRVAQQFMMRNYPGWVKSWIRSQGGLSGRMKTMSYGYASRFIKACGSAVVRRGSKSRLRVDG